MGSTDGGRAAASTFTPPVGYRTCGLDDIGSISEKELWVVRVPEGLDAASLDGVSIPLEALTGKAHGALASIEVPQDDSYDLLMATQTTAERVNAGPSQLIEMAGPSEDRVRVDHDFLRSAKSAGVATELVSVSALVPRKGSLRLAAPITRRLYLARQAPRAAHAGEASAPVSRARAQPWDRLKGIFRPTGSQAPTVRAETKEKKRKKDSKEEPKKKKQKQ
ncbi:hypothetical protein MEQU1_003668 [Malassezia equina]|uniref:Uncharacterized protein n=1 Tax=Malassezia equina TaxID=1381935 RepID=A0AAF0ELL5_9BASI|nr:hypothetical protein MEQU1_003668 [Malassezia equina]